MGVGGQRQAPASLPTEKTRNPLYTGLGGSQGRPGRIRKISLLPGFDPRTVQPEASRNSDWAVAAHAECCVYTHLHLSVMSSANLCGYQNGRYFEYF